jgi:hypothetical protein
MRFLFRGRFVLARIHVIVSTFLATAVTSHVLMSVAYGQEARKICPGVEVSSLHKTAQKPDPKPTEPAELLVFAGQAPTSSSVAMEQTLSVIALGPVLGSMDSTDVSSDLECTARGVRLTATITRSAHYTGSALKNILWRPKLALAVILRKNEVIFESVWVMRLSTGAKLDHAQTPSQPDLKYPITVTRTLSTGRP